MIEIEHLIVALRLPDVDGALVCIPHGFGGLHVARDFERFQARIRVASDPDDPARALHPGGAVGRNRDDDCMIYLARMSSHSCSTPRASSPAETPTASACRSSSARSAEDRRKNTGAGRFCGPRRPFTHRARVSPW